MQKTKISREINVARKRSLFVFFKIMAARCAVISSLSGFPCGEIAIQQRIQALHMLVCLANSTTLSGEHFSTLL
jgi:hypothetical protein